MRGVRNSTVRLENHKQKHKHVFLSFSHLSHLDAPGFLEGARNGRSEERRKGEREGGREGGRKGERDSEGKGDGGDEGDLDYQT